MESVVFFVAAVMALGGALGVVLLRNPFYSVLSLVVHLIALASCSCCCRRSSSPPPR